jgi:hypothetical protein
VVLTNPSVDPTVNATGCIVTTGPTDCFPSNYTSFNDWKTMGKPDCWCAKPKGSGYQCDGDAAGEVYGAKKYRVFTPDLTAVSNNWKKFITDTTLDPCADLDHKPYGAKKYRVFTPELTTLTNNWKKVDSQLPGDCPRTE